MYIGWVKAGRAGAALVALAFLAPSFLMAPGVAAAYLKFGELPWIQDMFYGVGAAVIAMIGQSAYRLSRKTIGADLFLWLLFAAVAITTVWTCSEIVWLFALRGGVQIVVKTPPSFLNKPSMRVLGPRWMVADRCPGRGFRRGFRNPHSGFFLKAGAFVFGSGLAIVPFLYGGVVREYHWLTERQFLDAIAVAMITPGPVVITAAFIGYLVAGLAGGTAAAAAVFTPPFLIVIIAAP